MHFKKLVVVLLVATACGEGQTGDGNTLRFGLQYQYAETDGFAAPIARGVKMPLGVQDPKKAALLNDYTYLEATLTATKSDGTAAEITRTAQGKFDGVFSSVGSYTLAATTSVTGVKDSLQVTVADIASLRLSNVSRVVDTFISDGTSCLKTLDKADPMPTLSSNQRLDITVVATDASGAALLGLLDLSATSDTLTTELPKTVLANELHLRPIAGKTGALTATVSDATTQKTLDVPVTVTADVASCPKK